MSVTVLQNNLIGVPSNGLPTYFTTPPDGKVRTSGDGTLSVFSQPDPYFRSDSYLASLRTPRMLRIGARIPAGFKVVTTSRLGVFYNSK